jgi:hypothetical protein
MLCGVSVFGAEARNQAVPTGRPCNAIDGCAAAAYVRSGASTDGQGEESSPRSPVADSKQALRLFRYFAMSLWAQVRGRTVASRSIVVKRGTRLKCHNHRCLSTK